MQLSRALTLTHDVAATAHTLNGLGTLLDSALVKSASKLPVSPLCASAACPWRQ